jgi:hypothetical protein
VIPESPHTQWLLNEVLQDTTQTWFLRHIEQVIQGNIDHKRSGSEVSEVDIRSDYSTIYYQEEEKSTISTHELYDLAKDLLKAKESLNEAYLAARPWHDLPIRLDVDYEGNAVWEQSRYFEPDTGRAGYFKDTPEGKEWFKRLKDDEQKCILD